MAQPNERNQDATVWVGDLDAQVTETLLWELMLQAGPVVNVYIPKDKVSGAHSGFGFVEFFGEEDAEYAIRVMVRASPISIAPQSNPTRSQNMVKLFGKPIRVNRAQRTARTSDVGANLFIGNLDPDVDEKLLYDTFSAFGQIISTPKIMRDPDTNSSKGYGFVSFDNFAVSDMAIEVMNGQYLCNRPISVTYALKKDSKGERHGTAAERLLAQQSAAKQMQQRIQPPMFPVGTPIAVAPAVAPVMSMPMAVPPTYAMMPPPQAMYGGYAPPPVGMRVCTQCMFGRCTHIACEGCCKYTPYCDIPCTRAVDNTPNLSC